MQEAERAAGDVEAEPGDPDYVEAMSYGMPPNGGCGIGIDRLAMVLSRPRHDPRRDPLPAPARARLRRPPDLATTAWFLVGSYDATVPRARMSRLRQRRPPFRAECRTGVKPLVLCYHAVSETWNHQLSVSPAALEAQLSLLLRRGYRPVGAAEAAAGERQAPPRHVRRRVHERPERAAGARAARGAGRRCSPAPATRTTAGRSASPELQAELRRAAGGARDDEWDELRELAQRGIEVELAHDLAPAPAHALRRRARRRAALVDASGSRTSSGGPARCSRTPSATATSASARRRARPATRRRSACRAMRPAATRSTSSASASGTATARGGSPSRPARSVRSPLAMRLRVALGVTHSGG